MELDFYKHRRVWAVFLMLISGLSLIWIPEHSIKIVATCNTIAAGLGLDSYIRPK